MIRRLAKIILLAGQILILALNLCALPATGPATAKSCCCCDDATATADCCCRREAPHDLADVLLRPATCRDSLPGTAAFVLKLDFVPTPVALLPGQTKADRFVACPAAVPATVSFEPPVPPPKFLVAS